MPARRPGIRFDLDWGTTAFTLLLFPVMVGLGFWQIQRAEEKAVIEARWEQRQAEAPVPLARVWGDSAAALNQAAVTLSGVFLQDEYFLLDNRIQGGRFGYEVIAIMALDAGEGLALVNRGWIAADPARLALPLVPAVSGRVELTGHVFVAPGAPYLLAEQTLGPGWPKLLQAVEMEKIVPVVGAVSGQRVFPYPVRIDAGEPGALAVEWQVVNMSPDKHRAYAAQWFTMALFLLVFFVMRSSNLWQLVKSSGGDRRK